MICLAVVADKNNDLTTNDFLECFSDDETSSVEGTAPSRLH